MVTPNRKKLCGSSGTEADTNLLYPLNLSLSWGRKQGEGDQLFNPLPQTRDGQAAGSSERSRHVNRCRRLRFRAGHPRCPCPHSASSFL
ncbi:hypothetical protein JZ751_020892 [Albula glossodonta]|uniref:Uncharacterized protein n=1 Tax=Albula glossodonta TaxID=121402 RepID=A0A8T2PNJ7_9TELE|nr:hypothetical protein JZ751_020892 [Albula glossodonta]